jgi:deoxycytidine triphosphate deaminase
MPKTITGEALKRIVEEGVVIQDGSVKNCGAIKYDFVLSDDFLKAEYGVPTRVSELEPEKRSEAIVSPGEVVYVLSKETVSLPQRMYMNLSANRGMSEYGVLTLGGFTVDPGYTGRLMFGLFNYSSTSFKLIPGKKLVGAVFYSLEEDESQGIDDYDPPKSINDFPLISNWI